MARSRKGEYDMEVIPQGALGSIIKYLNHGGASMKQLLSCYGLDMVCPP
jgi:hypothetical protein